MGRGGVEWGGVGGVVANRVLMIVSYVGGGFGGLSFQRGLLFNLVTQLFGRALVGGRKY